MRKKIPHYHGMSMEEWFWSKVDKRGPDECWEWQGVRNTRYGDFYWKKHRTTAHRYAYELTCGLIPKGLYGLHSCDNTFCCNPAHIHTGTQKENMAECVARGRLNPGGIKTRQNRVISVQNQINKGAFQCVQQQQ